MSFILFMTPWTYLHSTMDKTDIAHASNQYVEKLNIVLKTLRAIFCSVYYCLWNNAFIHNFNAKCLWCYTIVMVTPLTVTPQKTGKYFQDKRKIISSRLYFIL
jgi:hypothetical protein